MKRAYTRVIENEGIREPGTTSQHSNGGKDKILGISKRGNAY